MHRVRFAFAATLVTTTLCAGIAAAQTAPPMQSVLAGKKLSPPLKGEALIEFTAPVTKAVPGKNMVQTVIKVKNASLAPVARLQITETWFDKAGGVVAGDLEGGRAVETGGHQGVVHPPHVHLTAAERDGGHAAPEAGAPEFLPLGAEVLPVHVLDPVAEAADELHRVGAGEPGVAGVQVEGERGRGRLLALSRRLLARSRRIRARL